MAFDAETLIVGAGLAGACAALHVSLSQRVLVLEAERPAAGASGAAAGLVNPLMGRRAKAVWRMDDALGALQETLALAEAAHLFAHDGLLRPAGSADQAAHFQEVAARLPAYAKWLPLPAMLEQCPYVQAHGGALLVHQGGALPVPDVVRTVLAASQQRGAEVRTGTRVTAWGENASHAWVATSTGERWTAQRVLLTSGYGYRHFTELTALNLHGIKGQTLRVATPPNLHLPVPLSGHGYVVPDGEALIVGSSYEHSFETLAPSEAQSRAILQKASRMVPLLEELEVLDAAVGVRVTVPGTRLPMLGPLPGRSRIWIFTGLSSKGLLMAPLLARDLPLFFEQPGKIPKNIRVRTKP